MLLQRYHTICNITEKMYRDIISYNIAIISFYRPALLHMGRHNGLTEPTFVIYYVFYIIENLIRRCKNVWNLLCHKWHALIPSPHPTPSKSHWLYVNRCKYYENLNGIQAATRVLTLDYCWFFGFLKHDRTSTRNHVSIA